MPFVIHEVPALARCFQRNHCVKQMLLLLIVELHISVIACDDPLHAFQTKTVQSAVFLCGNEPPVLLEGVNPAGVDERNYGQLRLLFACNGQLNACVGIF